MEIRFRGFFEYKSSRHSLSTCGKCHLIIARDDLHIFALATELDDNPGASITNSVESLVEQVKYHFCLQSLNWFEHYPNNLDPRSRFTKWDNGIWQPSNRKEREILDILIETKT